MKLAVVGSRDGVSKDLVFDHLDKLTYKENIDMIITGGARGVDSYAQDFAEQFFVPYKVIRPIYPSLKVYYLYRNIEIITEADMIIAFWNGKSKGTKFVIDYASSRKKRVEIVNV